VLSNAMRAVRAYLSSSSSSSSSASTEDAKEESKGDEKEVSASAACVILADAEARQQQVPDSTEMRQMIDNQKIKSKK
jgi:hypothetical protein